MSSEEARVFETVSDTSYSRKDHVLAIYDQYVRAPFLIVWGNPKGKVGMIIVAFFLLMSTLGVVLVKPPSHPTNLGPTFVQPFQSWQFPLGTGVAGSDLWASLVHATPPMFKMIFSGAIFAVVLGTAVGTTAGYVGGRVDNVLSTISDTFMTIPGLPLFIVLGAIVGPENEYLIGAILAINMWAALARQIRSQVITLRNESYVEASQIMNVSMPVIVLVDILPNLMPYITVNFVRAARRVLFNSVALYFLGVLPFVNINWGVMLQQGYRNGGLVAGNAFFALLVPMLAITFFSIGLTFFAQGADRLFNARARARHAKTVETDDTEGA